MLFNFCRVLIVIILVPLLNITVFLFFWETFQQQQKRSLYHSLHLISQNRGFFHHFLQATIELSCCWSWWRRLSIAGPPTSQMPMEQFQMQKLPNVYTDYNNPFKDPLKKTTSKMERYGKSLLFFPLAQWSGWWIKVIPLWNFTSVPLWGFIWMHALSPFDLSPLQSSLLGTTKSKRCRFFWFGKAGWFRSIPFLVYALAYQALIVDPNAPMHFIWHDKESRKLRHVFLCTGWWFQIFFIFIHVHPYLGKIPIFD